MFFRIPCSLLNQSQQPNRMPYLFLTLVLTFAPLAVVCIAQVVAAEIPIPCCPLEHLPLPNLEEARYSPKVP